MIGSDPIVDRFDEEAPFWQEMFTLPDVQSVIHQRRLRLAIRLVDGLGLVPGAAILEVGAGAGLLAVALARRGFLVEATDPAPRMRDLIHERAVRAGVDARLHVSAADVTGLAFTAGCFDLAIALGVLPWLADPRAAVGEMVRVVRPGGYLIVSVVSRTPLPMLLDPLRHPGLGPLRDTLRSALTRITGMPFEGRQRPLSWLDPGVTDRMLAAAGLELVESVPFGYGPLTWFGRRAFPNRIGVGLDARLQRFGGTHPRFARHAATQYIVLARTPDR